MKLLIGLSAMNHTKRLMSQEGSFPGWQGISSLMKRFSLLLFALGLGTSMSSTLAQAMDSRLQIFVEVEGSVPGWSELALTVTQLNVTGLSTNQRPFSVTPFDGSHRLVVPRAAAGIARFLVAGNIPVGRVDQVNLTLGQVELLADQPLEGVRQRFVPDTVNNNGAVKLQYDRPVDQADGEVLSLVVSIKLGDNAIVTRDGVLVLDPVLRVARFSTLPGPENFLNGKETLQTGPTQMLPELGIQIARSKIYNPEGGVRDLTLRNDTGEPVSFSQVRRQNETLWQAKHGTLESALVDRLSTLSRTDLVMADVWLRVPGEGTFQPDGDISEGLDVAHAAFIASRKAAAAPIAASVSAALEAAGATILSVELTPPVLHIQISREALETQASLLINVLEIVETPPVGEVLAIEGAIDLVQNPLWLAHLIGFGERLRVAVAEPGACINTEHEAFRGVTFEEPVERPCTDTKGNDLGHSTAVASALAAFVGDPGSIDLVGLFNGTLFSSDLCTVNEALIDRIPHLVNLSCLSARQPPLDYAVFTHRIFVANGTGNSNQSTVPVNCDSYNSVCIAGYNHFSTVGPDNFGDDTPAGRWINDPATQREKPDLIGPYRAKLAYYEPNDGYDYRSGTSFSTPFVVGTAGLLISNYGEKLHKNPTLTRAVLMASASHSMTGHPPIPIYNDGIDDRAGAGAPRGDRGRAIMEDTNYFSGYLDRNADFDASGKLMTPISFTANAGEKVRVVLTYDQCQDDIKSVQDALLVDMDLVVRENSLDSGEPASRVHANNSHVDNSEIIEFAVSTHSQIHLDVSVQHWDSCANGSQKTWLAIAWDELPAP